MQGWSRRDVLKSSMAVQAATALGTPVRPATAQSGSAPTSVGAPSLRERLLLDFGWRFHFGHANDATKDFGFGSGRSGGFQRTGGFLSPSNLTFDDNDWTPADLPHDWAIGLAFKNDSALSSKGFYPLGRDYPETSVGWYRRVFELPASDAGKRISVEFDGAYRDTIVVFNGFYMGRHTGGYDPFSFDLTDFASFGGRNVLLVRVDATLSDGWFYEGAGIYRHVWLVKTAPVHVKKWGTLASAKIQPGAAAVSIKTEVENHGKGAQNVRVISTLLNPAGKEVGKAATTPASIAEFGERTYDQQVLVKQPALWSLEERNLYKVVTEVESGGTITDRYETRFGIRDLKFDADQGFLLNGKSVKVKGTCNHQDHAGVGAALPDAVQYFRVRKLQEMGCNGIRTSHNPPTPELLNACDELGMLVLSETRMLSSNPDGLAQFENMIRQHRNHPSVFVWSMGNEEGVSTTETGLKILTSMKRVGVKLDGSRPISIAPPPMQEPGRGGLVVCDVMGYNYADPQAEAYHKANPKIPIMGTENVSAVGTRGAYVTDRTKGTVASYDPYTTTGRGSAEGWWRFVSARPYISGGFVWTGFDYRGEPSPYQWPNISSQYGIIDTCGFPKDTFFYYRSWWTSKPVLHVFPHWNWPGMEGQLIAVWVHSNMDRVELFLNGQSLGAKDMQKDQHLAWNVAYAPGTIEARGFKDGRQVMTAKRETTGPAAKVVLRVDRQEISADGEDVAVVAAEVQDAQGRIVPITENEISFKVTGPGEVIATGNGDPTNHEPDPGSTRKAFAGLCMAMVQSAKSAAGSIRVEATSPGLTAGSATITTKAVRLRPQVAVWEREVPKGPGVTGLWRPTVAVAVAQTGNPMALAGGAADTVYTFRQDGNALTGSVESSGGATGATIEDGKVDGSSISFRTGATTYTGTINGDRIELRRAGGPTGRGGRGGAPGGAPATPVDSGPRPAIGPAPQGSDPSFGAGGGGGGRGGAQQAPAPTILRRVTR
jgi:beta-galactosidase